MGAVGVYLVRSKIPAGAATVTATAATAISTEEMIIYQMNMAYYLTKPLGQTDLLAVATAARTLKGYDKEQADAAGTYVYATGYSMMRRLALATWDGTSGIVTCNAESLDPTTGFNGSNHVTAGNKNKFITDLIAAAIVATDSEWDNILTANMHTKIDESQSHRSALINYFGGNPTTLSSDIVQY